MNARVILWCGYVEPGQDWDFQWSLHDLRIAYEALTKIGVAEANIHALVGRDDLLPEEFRGKYEGKATLDMLQKVLRASKPANTPLIFVATNHGIRDGLISTPSKAVEYGQKGNRTGHQGTRTLKPSALAEALKVWNGPQVLVIAACYAGVFLELGNAQKRLVLASCKGDEPYHLEDKDPPHSVFLEKFFEALGEVPGACPNTAFERAAANMPAQGFGHLPLKSGSVAWP